MATPPGPYNDWHHRRTRLHRVLQDEVGFIGNASTLEFRDQTPSRWSETQLSAAWSDAGNRSGRGAELNHVYVHVPICSSTYHFSRDKNRRLAHASLLDLWLDRVTTSLTTLAPSLQPFSFHSLYIGGGTPGLLSPTQLERLFRLLDTHISFVRNAGRYVEVDPYVLSEHTIATLHAHGVNHVALRVPNLDANVAEAHDHDRRDPGLVKRCVQAIHDAGIGSTSVDFRLGIQGTDPRSAVSDIDQVIGETAPSWVQVYFIPPTVRTVDLHFSGSYKAFWDHQASFAGRASVELAKICQTHGYDLYGEVNDAFVLRRRPRGLVHRLKPAKAIANRINDFFNSNPSWLTSWPRSLWSRLYGRSAPPYLYRRFVAEQHRPLNLLGLGSGAQGRIFGSLLYEVTDPPNDSETQDGHEYLITTTDMTFEARSYLFDLLRGANHLPAARFEALFGTEVRHLFPEVLHAWRRAGIAEIAPSGDVTLRASSEQDRGRTLLWLLDDTMLEAKVFRHRKIDLSRELLIHMVHPFTEGQHITPGVILSEIGERTLTLLQRDARHTIRVAPRLDRAAGLVLVHNSITSSSYDQGIHQTIQTLQRIFVRNGSDELGSNVRPTTSTGRPSHADQDQPSLNNEEMDRRALPRDPVPAPVHDPTADPSRPLQPTDVRSFHERGYLAPIPILNSAEVDRFRSWLEDIEVVQEARHGGHWTKRNVHPDVRHDHPLFTWANELVRHPRLLDAVSGLLGETILVRNVDLFVREPRSRDGVVWHRDTAHQEADTHRLITAWIALTHASQDNGALEFVVGSHGFTLADERLTKHHLSLDSACVRQLKAHRIEPNRLFPGEASLHHHRLIHRSLANTTRSRRIGVAIRFFAPDVPPTITDCQTAMLVRGKPTDSVYQLRTRVPVSWRG